jgi:2-iminoacetate synthase ThiH
MLRVTFLKTKRTAAFLSYSIMIEENVVSSAGASYKSDEEELQKAIKEAGFEPWLRNQDYTPRLRADSV